MHETITLCRQLGMICHWYHCYTGMYWCFERAPVTQSHSLSWFHHHCNSTPVTSPNQRGPCKRRSCQDHTILPQNSKPKPSMYSAYFVLHMTLYYFSTCILGFSRQIQKGAAFSFLFSSTCTGFFGILHIRTCLASSLHRCIHETMWVGDQHFLPLLYATHCLTLMTS